MIWSDERYVRLYTRDTPDWQCLSFLAQGLFCLVLRKVDRAGVLPLGRAGRRAVAIAVGHAHQWPMLEPALDELLADGCLRIEGDLLVVPNFLEAQEAEASDAARAKKHREKRRDLAKRGLKPSSQDVTLRHAEQESRDGGDTKRDAGVTGCDETVTPSLPCRAEPSEPSVGSTADKTVVPMPARLRAGGTRMGPLGSRLVQAVEQGLGHGLIPLRLQQDADDLEALVAERGYEQAFQFIAATCRKREVDPEAVAWLVAVLRPSAGRGSSR